MQTKVEKTEIIFLCFCTELFFYDRKVPSMTYVGVAENALLEGIALQLIHPELKF